MKLRKMPVIIEAVRFFPAEWQIDPEYKGKQLSPLGVYTDKESSTGYSIDTLEGKHEVTPGHYTVRGVKGEKSPVETEIFR
jgi:hypothetical protein